MANFKLSKQSSEGEIQAYFTSVLELVKLNEKFPVNLEDVWPLVYNRKEEAVRALKSDDLFMQDVDYQVLRKNAERSDEPLHQNGERSANGQFNGANKVTYMLSVPCLEFFIARRVRPVFEVYRKIFHMTMGEAEKKVERKPTVDELAELGCYYRDLSLHSTIDEYCEPIISARAYYEFVYTGDLRGRDFEEWFSQRACALSFQLNQNYNVMKRPTEWEPKPKGQDFALNLLALLKLADYDSGIYKSTDPERSRRAGGIGQWFSDCCVKLDYEEEHYTVSQFVVDMREHIYGVRALQMRVPHMERIVDGSDGFAPDSAPLSASTVAAVCCDDMAAARADVDAWAVYDVVEEKKPQGVDLASPDLTTRDVCQALKSFGDEVTARFAAATEREQKPDGKKSIGQVATDFKSALYSLRTTLCNLVYIEEALRSDYPDTAAADQAEAGKEAAV